MSIVDDTTAFRAPAPLTPNNASTSINQQHGGSVNTTRLQASTVKDVRRRFPIAAMHYFPMLTYTDATVTTVESDSDSSDISETPFTSRPQRQPSNSFARPIPPSVQRRNSNMPPPDSDSADRRRSSGIPPERIADDDDDYAVSTVTGVEDECVSQGTAHSVFTELTDTDFDRVQQDIDEFARREEETNRSARNNILSDRAEHKIEAAMIYTMERTDIDAREKRQDLVSLIKKIKPKSDTGIVSAVHLFAGGLDKIRKTTLPECLTVYDVAETTERLFDAALIPMQLVYEKQNSKSISKNQVPGRIFSTSLSKYQVASAAALVVRDGHDDGDDEDADEMTDESRAQKDENDGNSIRLSRKRMQKRPLVRSRAAFGSADLMHMALEAERVLNTADMFRQTKKRRLNIDDDDDDDDDNHNNRKMPSAAAGVIRSVNKLWFYCAPREVITQPTASIFGARMFEDSKEEADRKMEELRQKRKNERKRGQSQRKRAELERNRAHMLAAEAGDVEQRDGSDDDENGDGNDDEADHQQQSSNINMNADGSMQERRRIADASILHKQLFKLWTDNEMNSRDEEAKANFYHQFLHQATYHSTVEQIYLFTLLQRERAVEIAFTDATYRRPRTADDDDDDDDKGEASVITMPYIATVNAPSKLAQVAKIHRKDRVNGSVHERATYPMSYPITQWKKANLAFRGATGASQASSGGRRRQATYVSQCAPFSNNRPQQ